MSTRTDMTRTRGQITFHPVCVPAEVLERKNARCKCGFNAVFYGRLANSEARVFICSNTSSKQFGTYDFAVPLTRLATSIVVWTKIPKKRFRRWLKSAFSIFFNEDRRRRGRKWTKTMIAMAFRLGSWKNIRPKYKLWRRDMHIQIKKYMHTHSWPEFWFCVFSCWLLFYLTFPVQFVWGIPARAFCIGNWAKLPRCEHNDTRLHEFMHVEKTKTMCTGRILKAPHNEAALWETEMLASAKKCAISVPFLRFVRFFTDFWLVFLKVSLCALSSLIWPTIWGFNFGAEGPGRPRSWEPSEFQRLFVASSACDSLYKTRVLLMPGAICKFQHRSARIYDIYIYCIYVCIYLQYIYKLRYTYQSYAFTIYLYTSFELSALSFLAFQFMSIFELQTSLFTTLADPYISSHASLQEMSAEVGRMIGTDSELWGYFECTLGIEIIEMSLTDLDRLDKVTRCGLPSLLCSLHCSEVWF